MTAPILPSGPDAIAHAVERLLAGALVVMPTETVYGLAADGRQPNAVARVFAAKGRPRFNPLIAHVANLDMAKAEAVFNPVAVRLAGAFWPGPLTLVLPVSAAGTVCDLGRAGLDTIAIRAPGHPTALSLIAGVCGPLVAPSANLSGQLSPVDAGTVRDTLGDRVDIILDGGPSRVGLESTVVDCTGDDPVVLRPGGVSHGDLEAALGRPIERSAGNPDAPISPGQLLRHYAPRARLRLNAVQAEQGESMLAFGAMRGDLNLSAGGDTTEAAANLFAMLRTLDARSSAIAVAPIPETGLGEAINDRLRRAAER